MGFENGNDDEVDCWWEDISGEIYVFDIENNKCKTCAVRWPMDRKMKSIMIRDAERENLLTFGYINMCFKESEFNDLLLLPDYLIGNWFVIEHIHLFAYHPVFTGPYSNAEFGREHDHWKIDVDHVIASIED